MFDKFLKNIAKGLKKSVEGENNKHDDRPGDRHDRRRDDDRPGDRNDRRRDDNRPSDRHDRRRESDRNEYFAVVFKSGSLFFEGNIPDISFDRARVTMCSSYDKLMEQLTKKLDEELERCKRLNQPFPERSSRGEIEAKFPGKEIVTICSLVTR